MTGPLGEGKKNSRPSGRRKSAEAKTGRPGPGAVRTSSADSPQKGQNEKSGTTFLIRTISGAVLLALIIATGAVGGDVLLLGVAFISVIGMREFYNAAGITGRPFSLIELAGYAGALGYFAVLRFAPEGFILPELAGSCALLLLIYVVTFPEYKTENITGAFFGLFYVAVMLSFIYLTRCRFKGNIEIWLIYITSWGADTCAYLAGMAFGKHKMTKKLSPKKSVEGAVGGVLGSVLLGLIFAAVFKQPKLVYVLICLVSAVLSMIGDLAASAIKRKADIKDYGKLIPGHGGILDRFDSVIFTAPVIYFCCLALLG